MCSRSISFVIALLLIGCEATFAPIRLAPASIKTPDNLTLHVRIPKREHFGSLGKDERPIRIIGDLRAYITQLFLRDLPSAKGRLEIVIDLGKLEIVERDGMVYGYAQFELQVRGAAKVMHERVVVRRITSVHDQEELEELLKGVLRDGVAILKERYALLAL